MTSNIPTVSVVIPARNAGALLASALESIAGQTYPRIVDVIVAAADAESAAAAKGATVVDNPSGKTPTGLNLAIAQATGDVIVRCDAQSALPPDYIEKAVQSLQSTGAANVGGMQVPVGQTPWESAIASAMKSPLGAGDARYRLGGDAGPAETVYLGVFRRNTLERIGGFDESFARTQDYELNHRLISAGETVWFDPALKVTYRPRGSLKGLAIQYFQYGRAKRMFARRHRGSLRWRQVVPPVLTIVIAATIIASFWIPVVLVAPALYVVSMVVLSLPSLRKAAALITMHLSWGVGFLRG